LQHQVGRVSVAAQRQISLPLPRRLGHNIYARSPDPKRGSYGSGRRQGRAQRSRWRQGTRQPPKDVPRPLHLPWAVGAQPLVDEHRRPQPRRW
jgi:hypothetical protein